MSRPALLSSISPLVSPSSRAGFLLAGLCLSSAASAAVLNTNSYSVLVRYGDTHEFRESDDLTSSGFLDNSFEFMPPNGEAKIEMLADVTGLDLKASAF